MRIPPLLADFIHARACKPKCEKFLTRPVSQACARQSRWTSGHGSGSSPAAVRFFFRNIHHSQIWHFQQAIIGGKDACGLSHLAQLAVETINDIGGIDQPTHLLGVLEIGAEIGPIGPPEG